MKRVLSEFVFVSYFLGKVYELQCEGESFTQDITISGRRVAAPSLPPLPCTVGSMSDKGGAFCTGATSRQAGVSRNGAPCVSFFTRGCLEPVAREGEPPCTRCLP